MTHEYVALHLLATHDSMRTLFVCLGGGGGGVVSKGHWVTALNSPILPSVHP